MLIGPDHGSQRFNPKLNWLNFECFGNGVIRLVCEYKKKIIIVPWICEISLYSLLVISPFNQGRTFKLHLHFAHIIVQKILTLLPKKKEKKLKSLHIKLQLKRKTTKKKCACLLKNLFKHALIIFCIYYFTLMLMKIICTLYQLLFIAEITFFMILL